MFEVSYSIHDNSVEAIETNKFRVHLNIGRLHVKQFVKWAVSSNAVPAKKIADIIRAKASARSKPFTQTIFVSFSDPNFQKMGTEQAWQVLRAFFRIATNGKRGSRVRNFLYTFFHPGGSSMALINTGQLLQTV